MMNTANVDPSITKSEFPTAFERKSRTIFYVVSALIFAASAAVTIIWCASMSKMGGMPMPGGWTMSMAWMRMPAQSWLNAALLFIAMWIVMMIAMMMPSLIPMLQRYRSAIVHREKAPVGILTFIAGAGYFFIWTLFGVIAFPIGVVIAELEMRDAMLSRAVPFATGIIIFFAGLLQFTPWKARQLACCREAPGQNTQLPAGIRTAWSYGMRLGLHCTRCCAGLMVILLVIGVMDLRAMAVVAAAITIERIAPAGQRIAHAVGFVIVAAGLFLIARAALLP